MLKLRYKVMTEIALIGKKIGMTREFYKTGQSVPVTVIKMEKGRIIDLIQEDKRGYKAVQVGFGKIKNSKLSKSMKGYYTKKNTEPKKTLKEFRVDKLDNYKEGNELGLEIFKDAKFVDVRSKTIGKGFAGAMKRHNFGGLRASHGVSISHRAHGSTGQNQDPGKVFKGKKIGMTREFYKSGQSVPVTAVKIDKGRIIQLISKDQRGYNAIQVGFGKIKNSKLSKQMKGFFSKKNTEPKKILK